MRIDSTRKLVFAILGIFAGLYLPEIIDFILGLFR